MYTNFKKFLVQTLFFLHNSMIISWYKIFGTNGMHKRSVFYLAF